MKKTSLAMVGLTGCSGCSISFLDLGEELLEVFKRFNLEYSTTLMDVKKLDHVAVCIVEGCVANDHDVETVRMARENADIIVTLGSCACFGGINALRNLQDAENVLKTSYVSAEITTSGSIPTDVPKLLPAVKAVEDVIKVDYAIPGCPPVPKLIESGLKDILKGRPIKEPNKNLCSECNRIHERMLIPQREFLSFDIFHTIEVDLDKNTCFLEHGVLCLGPVTKAGCGGRCLSVDMPCRGCMGPPKAARDQGCITINALASLLPVGILAEREDLIGTAYRFSLAHSTILKAKIQLKNGGK